jgi:hypothetical protein
MTEKTAKRIATLIVDDLFQNGTGDKAERLVLTINGPPKRDLGGWSRGPMIDRIADMLSACALK